MRGGVIGSSGGGGGGVIVTNCISTKSNFG